MHAGPRGPGPAAALLPADTHTRPLPRPRRVVGELMDRLCMGGVDAKAAAQEIALMVLGAGVTSMDAFGFAGQLQGAAEDGACAGAREGALLAYA